MEGAFDDDDNTDDEFLTRVAEKLMQLSIAFITQYFPGGDDLRSPLTHFADVMGISNKLRHFQEPYNYTSYVAALLWMCRLLVMEYALPSRAYTTLGWPAGDTYLDKGGRFISLHRRHLTVGSFGPVNRLVRVLAFGRQSVRAVGRPCLIHWDLDDQGLRLYDIHLRLDAFKRFVSDGIKSTKKTLYEQLFFGMGPPKIDLMSIRDVISAEKPLYSIMEASVDRLPEGRMFMLNLMKSADPSKHLIDAQGRWNRGKVNEYLKAKKIFLRRLMKGVSQTI